jgi:hypothetical protein
MIESNFQKLVKLIFSTVSIIFIILIGITSLNNFRNYYLSQQNSFENSWMFTSDSVPTSWNMESHEVFMESSLFFGIIQLLFTCLMIYILSNKLDYRHLFIFVISLFLLGYEFYLLISQLP